MGAEAAVIAAMIANAVKASGTVRKNRARGIREDSKKDQLRWLFMPRA
jgi:hypothetical protein